MRATAAALRSFGAGIPEDWGGEVVLDPPAEWSDARAPLDCGNSGTSARLLTGLIAGLGVSAELDGDASLRRRPMDRVVYPLQAMGARLHYLEETGRLPLRVERRASGSLRVLRHRPRVASAQVKSALLLAAVAGRTDVEVMEPGPSRDHTERLLRAMGAPIELGAGMGGRTPAAGSGAPETPSAREGAAGEPEPARIRLAGRGWTGELRPLDFQIPGDLSSAAFLLAAAMLGGEPVRITGVGLNPTRAGFLRVVREMRGRIQVAETGDRDAPAEPDEPTGDIEASASPLVAFDIDESRVPILLDEVPALAALAARASGTSVLCGAAELRVKESDRLARLAAGLREIGVVCRERPDGLEIEGTDRALRGRVETAGDHRIAMAFGVLAGLPGSEIRIDDPDCVSVSYPGFWRDLARVLSGAAPFAGAGAART